MDASLSQSPSESRPLASGRRAFLQRLLAAGLAMAGGAGLAACTPRSRAPLRVGTGTWVGNETMHVAFARGGIPGERVHLVRLPSSTAVLQGLLTGQLDAASLTLDELLSARQDSLDLRVVAVLDVSAGADCVLGRPGLETAQALRGRTVAVEKTAVGAVLLDAFLRHHGLTVEDIRTIYVPGNRQVSAWAEGLAEVIVSYDPFAVLIEAMGAVRLFDSSQIPGRIIDVLVTVHPCNDFCVEALALLLVGHFGVIDEIHDGSDTAQAMLAANLGLTTEQLRGSLARLELTDRAANRQWILGDPPRLLGSAADLARVMLAAGLLPSPPRLYDLIDARAFRMVDSA